MRLRFERRGRRPVAIAVLAIVWSALVLAVLWLDAALWIVAILALFTAPALADVVLDRRDWLEIDGDALAWGSGAHEARVARARIDHLRLERRLDLSLRARVVLDTGQRLIIPQACLPSAARLETWLTERGFAVERHPFSLL